MTMPGAEAGEAQAMDRYADHPTTKARDISDLPVHETLVRHDQALASQAATVEILANVTSELENRLGPVLAEPGPDRPRADREETGGVPFSGQSPVAGRVTALTGTANEIERGIQRHVERLRDLTARLEV